MSDKIFEPSMGGGRDRTGLQSEVPGAKIPDPTSKITRAKKGWKSGSSGRAPAQQAKRL
jgi:hypothetical protein